MRKALRYDTVLKGNTQLDDLAGTNEIWISNVAIPFNDLVDGRLRFLWAQGPVIPRMRRTGVNGALAFLSNR